MNNLSFLIITGLIFSFCSAQDGSLCKPLSIFESDCKVCICAPTGLDYKCSKNKCTKEKIKRNVYEDEDEFDDYNYLAPSINFNEDKNDDDDDELSIENNKIDFSNLLDTENDSDDITNDNLDNDFSDEDDKNTLQYVYKLLGDGGSNDDNSDEYDDENDKNIQQYVYKLLRGGASNDDNSDEYDDDFNTLRSEKWNQVLGLK